MPTGDAEHRRVGVDFVIRDGIIMQTMGPTGLGYMPYLTALFFFIFFSNIFEVIPGSSCRPTPAWPSRWFWR